MDNINKKITNATKWSALAEVAAKLVLPVVNMILARLLTPEAFGIVATVNIAISFAEVFQDAGFQKYIIQREFATEEDFEKSANVAFWTNLALSTLLWVVIVLFRAPISRLIGGPGLGLEMAVASFSLPVFAVSSIQISYFKRNFHFRKIFWVRVITSAIPLVVTVPLAVIFRNHWALIMGTVIRNLVQAIVLYSGSAWKPRLSYSVGRLKEMGPFCLWTLLESLSIWLTANVSILIVTHIMDMEAVGYYKTSMTTVTSITGIVSAATLSVLFSALSRLQNQEAEFRRVFYDFQKIIAMFALPLGAGIWLYRDLAVKILLGEAWMRCADFVGMYAFAMAFAIVTNSFFSELYRAKGQPRISMLAQVLYLILLAPSVAVSSRFGFEALCITTTILIFVFSVIHFSIAKWKFGLRPGVILGNLAPILAATGIMTVAGYLLRSVSQNLFWEIASILICMALYAVLSVCIKPLRQTLRTSEFTSMLFGKLEKAIRKNCWK